MSAGSSPTFILTSGRDEVVASASDQTVRGTSATLTTAGPGSSDKLDGGAGYDVLELSGGGSFNLAGLDGFSGFEEVRLVNTTGSSANLILRDGVDIAVSLSSGTPGSAGSLYFPDVSVTLGTGRVTLHGGDGSDAISATGAARLRAGDVIDGGAGTDALNLNFDYTNSTGGTYDPATGKFTPLVYGNTVYDLTQINLSHVETLRIGGTSFNSAATVMTVDAAALADVTSISMSGEARLTTTAASLDLSGRSVSGGQVESGNASGTLFTASSAATAMQIIGGVGSDTVVVKGVTLSAAQREQIFSGSIETIQDASGTYAKPALPVGTVALTTDRDVIAASSSDQVIQATHATLTTTKGAGGNDSLDGGDGYDVLALYGSGDFNLNGLDKLSGFEEIRLTNATRSLANLFLRDGVDGIVTLGDGTAAPSPFSNTGGITVGLGTGLVTLRGGNETDFFSATSVSRLRAGDVIDGGGGSDTLGVSFDFSNYTGGYNAATGTYTPMTYGDAVYDLTKVSLSHVETLFLSTFGNSDGARTVVKVDAASLADVTTIRGNALSGTAAVLTTDAASLDLSGRTLSYMRIESGNTAGTTFTVDSASAALQVAGGAGADTLVAKGLTLTDTQRQQIFSGSIETITDISGTYTKAGGAPDTSGTVTLTTGRDTVLATSADQTVLGNGMTLTTTGSGSGDRLDGGAGYDVLSLTGPGNFDLTGLDSFTGFEEVRFTAQSYSSLTLRDGIDIAVTLGDGGSGPYSYTSISTTLGIGRVTLHGGAESDTISATGASRLQAGSVIDGGTGSDTLSLSFDYTNRTGGTYDSTTGTFTPMVYGDTIYDLTAIGLSHVESLSLNGPFSNFYNGARTIAKVDAASLADVTSISSYNGNVGITTAAASLDLSGKSVSGVLVESGNASGTTFTVDSVATALQIVGGSGSDTLVVKASSLSDAQREQIFAGSIETITDASGTFTKPSLPPGTTALTSGRDVVSASSADQTVQATAQTLAARGSAGSNDSLEGGGGYDVLKLYGSGGFDLTALDTFTGFEEVRLTNASPTSPANLILRDGTDLTVTLSDGASAPHDEGSSAPDFLNFFDPDISVALGAGTVMLRAGYEIDAISAVGAGRLRAGSVIDGGGGRYDSLSLLFDYGNSTGGTYDPATGTVSPTVYGDTVYDLTAVKLSHVEALTVSGPFSASNGARTVVKVDAASLADLVTLSGSYGSTTSVITTAASNLDLSGRTLSYLQVESSNAAGTTFTVDSAGAALQIVGGAGNDTVVVKGVTLTAAQRDQIFGGSVETITDASGTFAKPGTAGTPGAIGLSGLTDGHAVEGQAITATVTDPDGVPAGLTYGFKSGTTVLQSGSSASYTPTHDDIGATIRVEIAYTDGQGHAESLVQSAGTVSAAPLFTVTGATSGDDALYGQSGTNRAELIDGLAGNDRLYGYGGADHLIGGAGNDRLDGGTGADLMEGGADNDTYYVDNAGDQVLEAAGGGTDSIYTSVSYTLGAGQEVEFLRANAGTTGLMLTGNELANGLISGAGNDVLVGGVGNDTYNVDGSGDQVIEAAGGGTDTVFTSVDYTLGAGQEIEFLRANAGTTGLKLTGNELANTLYGGAGIDTLAGGRGNDTYYVANAGDVVKEAVGGGTDTVYASVSYTLQAGQEVEFLAANAGSTGLTLTGNERANNLISGAGNDVLVGGAGNDTYNVNNTGDRVVEASGGGSDNVFSSVDYTLAAGQEIEQLFANAGNTGLTLTGNEFANRVVGGAGADHILGGGGKDVIDGRGGADILEGGTGDDLYYVDNVGDQVIEAAGGGIDNVYTSVSFTLAAGQEVEYLRAGTADGTGLTLTGNERNDGLISGAGNDVLIGGLGNDTYNVNNAGDRVVEQVGQGIDTVFTSVSYTLEAGQEIEYLRANSGSVGLTLTGNEFANTFYASYGNDTLIGGGGNDTYWVNNTNDVVKEAVGGGVDNVYTSANYTLGAGQEIEFLRANAGTTGLTLTGNERDNALISGFGNDVLVGGAGNDTYNVDNTGDQVIEQAGGGSDTIYASVSYTLGAGQEVEFLRANAGSTGLTLTGNALANTIIGGAGTDTLAGGGGADVLRGGGGADSFVFKALSDSVVGAVRVTIADFVAGVDRIDLSAIQAVSGADGDQAFGFIGTGAFTGQAGQLHQVALGANTLIEGDVNGDGVADFQIALTGKLTLQQTDFVL